MEALNSRLTEKSGPVDKLLGDSSPGGGVDVIGSKQVYREQADINLETEHTFVMYLACQHIKVRWWGIPSSQLKPV